VIGIIGILSTVVLLTLNPTELLKQSRDSTRIAELTSLDKAIGFASSQNPDLVLGTANTVYLSLSDNDGTPDCDDYLASLPPIVSPWQYRCVAESNLRKIDGSGWLPVDFTSLTIVPIDTLAVDRVNTAISGLYYSYVVGNGTWELNAQMESKKYQWQGQADVESTDGGNTIVLFEKGNNLNIMPKEANARFTTILRIPTAVGDCENINPQTGVQFNAYFPRWTIPGSKRVAVTNLWHWQWDSSLGVGETLTMALYKDNNPKKRMSDFVTINGNGIAQSWMSGTLSSPVEVNLGSTYIFGIGNDEGGQAYSLSVEAGGLGGCSNYPPNTTTTTGYVDGNTAVLSDTVTGTGFGGAQIGIVGISYAEN
ncbi:MAG: Uncharacterized protein G01um101420_433, partial [Parcubacteria group bacterium Gr01-1014_20]